MKKSRFNEDQITGVLREKEAGSQRQVKDPSTGRRVARLKPESESIVTDVPQLRVVDEEL